MGKSALSFSGTIYAAPLDINKNLVGGFRRIGNVYPFSIKVDTEQKKQNHRYCRILDYALMGRPELCLGSVR